MLEKKTELHKIQSESLIHLENCQQKQMSSVCINTISGVARKGLKAQEIQAAWLEISPWTVKVIILFLTLDRKKS
jgi:hypothetical protein